MAIDWDGLANKALYTAIDVIQHKVEGTATGSGVRISPSGIQAWGASILVPFVVIGGAFVALVLLLRKA